MKLVQAPLPEESSVSCVSGPQGAPITPQQSSLWSDFSVEPHLDVAVSPSLPGAEGKRLHSLRPQSLPSYVSSVAL